MSTAVWTNRLELNSVADTALKIATRSWFVVAVIGQLVFAFTVASFYGLAAARGNLQAWNKTLPHRYVSGNTIGNTALAAHLLFAATIILSGALQLIPQIRARFPIFHRWNGRIYVLIAFTMGITGLYLGLSGRNIAGDVTHTWATNRRPSPTIKNPCSLTQRTAMPSRCFRNSALPE